jgi:hypothetical protein
MTLTEQQNPNKWKKELVLASGLVAIGGFALYSKAIFQQFGWRYPNWLASFDAAMDRAFRVSLLWPIGPQLSAPSTDRDSAK